MMNLHGFFLYSYFCCVALLYLYHHAFHHYNILGLYINL